MKRLLITTVALLVLALQSYANDSTYLNFTAVGGGATVKLSNVPANWTGNVNLQYSTDSCATWKDYSFGHEISLPTDSTVFFKATTTNESFSDKSKFFIFEMTGKVSADGNIMSLLDSSMKRNDVPEYAFYDLFNGCTSLIKAPALPADTMNESCYKRMFYGCQSLTDAPDLPAMVLADNCYESMFSQCQSLVHIPNLPATTAAFFCYNSMFKGCSSLKIDTTPPGVKWQVNVTNPSTYPCFNIFRNTGGTFTETPESGIIYYVSSDSSVFVADKDTLIYNVEGERQDIDIEEDSSFVITTVLTNDSSLVTEFTNDSVENIEVTSDDELIENTPVEEADTLTDFVIVAETKESTDETTDTLYNQTDEDTTQTKPIEPVIVSQKNNIPNTIASNSSPTTKPKKKVVQDTEYDEKPTQKRKTETVISPEKDMTNQISPQENDEAETASDTVKENDEIDKKHDEVKDSTSKPKNSAVGKLKPLWYKRYGWTIVLCLALLVVIVLIFVAGKKRNKKEDTESGITHGEEKKHTIPFENKKNSISDLDLEAVERSGVKIIKRNSVEEHKEPIVEETKQPEETVNVANDEIQPIVKVNDETQESVNVANDEIEPVEEANDETQEPVNVVNDEIKPVVETNDETQEPVNVVNDEIEPVVEANDETQEPVNATNNVAEPIAEENNEIEEAANVGNDVVEPVAEEVKQSTAVKTIAEPTKEDEERTIVLKGKTNTYVEFIPDRIVYIKADKNYITIYYLNNRKKIVSTKMYQSLSTALATLSTVERFFRCHRSFAVNMRFVTSWDEFNVKTTCTKPIPSSKTYMDKFEEENKKK